MSTRAPFRIASGVQLERVAPVLERVLGARPSPAAACRAGVRGTKPQPSSRASARPRMKPRASAPTTRSGSAAAPTPPGSTIACAGASVREQRHDVLEDDSRAAGSPGRSRTTRSQVEYVSRRVDASRRRAAAARARRAGGRAPAPARRASGGPRARLAPLRVARAQRRRDELLEQARLALGARCGTSAGAGRRSRSARAARRRPRSRRRSRRRAARPPSTRGASRPNSSSSRASSASISARSQSSSGRARPRARQRRPAGAACGPPLRPRASSCRITRSGRNSSRCSSQDRLEPLDVLLAEQPVAALRALRREQALVLEVADLRDRDVRELRLQPPADGADRGRRGCCAALVGCGRRRAHRRRKVRRYLPIWSSSPSSSSADSMRAG